MLDRILNRLEEVIIVSLIAMATTLTFVAVVHRYGASNSANLARWAAVHNLPFLKYTANWVYTGLVAVHLSWANELSTYMFVWMAKFGAALGVRTGIHVGVDVFVKRLSPAARKPVIVFALLCGALFTGVIGTLGAVYVYELDPDQTSPELELPSWIVYLCIPLGSYLMCFRFLQVMWRYPAHRLRAASGPRHRIRGAARHGAARRDGPAGEAAR